MVTDQVRDEIVAAHQSVHIAREHLADAVRTLTDLQHDVARAEVGKPPRERDQVDRLGRVARPDDLRNVRLDERRNLRTRAFEGVGRAGIFHL